MLLPLQVKTIGDLYSISNSLPTFHLPSVNYELVKTALPDAFTIALLAAIESLLSCVVADGMINSKHRSNMELIAQGAGNMASAFFGGIPATGAIARTAAILFMVACNMCQWRTFVHMLKTSPGSDISVLLNTFVLTIVFDLVIAIEFGMILACMTFLKRMSDETSVRGWTYVDDDSTEVNEHLRRLPKGVRVYEITGPLFFGAANIIEQIIVEDSTKCLVLRMRAVPSIDTTSLNALVELQNKCQKLGITMILSHVNPQPEKAMKKAGFADRIGQENFRPNIEAALQRAEKIVSQGDNK